MKKLLYPFVLLFAIAIVSASSVSRDMPARISPGEDISVTLSVSGAEPGKTFTLEDTVPAGWTLKSWDVSGSQESKDKISHRFEGVSHGWSFTASSTSPGITYVLSIPSNAEQKSYSFKALWFDPSGFFNQEGSTVVRSITCGDGVCEGAENSDSCEADCPKPPVNTVTPPPEQGQVQSEEEKGINPFLIVVLLLVIIAAFAAYFLFVRKKE